ncbi:MAG: hypothetical protein MJ239_04050 [Bacilli bacterium]|nr:hypothetical protein [Bacilli bacterium]
MKNVKNLVLVGLSALALASCGGGGGGKTDENTISVKMYLGGYGSSWLSNLKKQFETVYKDQGYKINLLTPSPTNEGSTTMNELKQGYAKKKVDVYFSANIAPQQLFNNVDRDAVIPLDDLVYNQKAIKYDGTEEEKTVAEKLDKSFGEQWYKYEGQSYGFFYQKSVGAMAVNRRKLNSLGIEKLPVTSKELLDDIHEIYKKRVSGETTYSPIVAVGAKQNGYPAVMLYDFMTQYEGIEGWNTFWSLNKEDGTYNKEAGNQEFRREGIYKAAKAVYSVLDSRNIVAGSTATSFDLAKAHSSLMNSNSGGVFMFDGDWILNECATDFASKLGDLDFMNVPVLSDVGTKLFGSIYTDENQCDAVLARAIRLADAKKSDEEIATTIASEFGQAVPTEAIAAVKKARGVYCNRGQQTGTVYVPSGLPDTHKDMVGKLLRMLASDDFAKAYFTDARCFSPYAESSVYDQSSLSDFSKAHMSIVTNENAESIWPITSGLRKQISALTTTFPLCYNLLHYQAWSSNATGYDDYGNFLGYEPYSTASKAKIDEEADYVDKNWASWTKDVA